MRQASLTTRMLADYAGAVRLSIGICDRTCNPRIARPAATGSKMPVTPWMQGWPVGAPVVTCCCFTPEAAVLAAWLQSRRSGSARRSPSRASACPAAASTPPLRSCAWSPSGASSTGAETNAIARATPVGRPGLGRKWPLTGSVRRGVGAPRTSFALADRHELHVPWDREHQLALVWLISQR